MIRRQWLWTILAAAPLLLAADGPQVVKAKDVKHPKLAIVTNNASDFWRICHAGVRRFEKEADVTIDFKTCSNGQPDEQKSVIDDLLDDGYDGVAVSPIDPRNQSAYLGKVAGKTNLVCFDTDCPASGRVVFIGVDNVGAGKRLGKRLVELLPNGGKVGVLCGIFTAQNASERLAGIEQAIDGRKIELIKLEDQTDRTKARHNAADCLDKGYDLMVGLWSYEGPVIADAEVAAGVKGKAVVFDEEQATLQGVAAGTIDSTFVQQPDEMGYQTAKWLYELATKGADAKIPAGGTIMLSVKKIDVKNVEAFRDDLKKLKGDQ